MVDRQPIRPTLFTVPFGQDFCDAVVADILRRLDESDYPLSDAVLLLPNNRAITAITGAFIRVAAPGLLLPKMAAIGDLNIDETLGAILDPLDTTSESDIFPAIDPMERLVMLADLISKQKIAKGERISATEAIKMARLLAATIDELNIEKIELRDFPVLGTEHDLAMHWQKAYGDLLVIWPQYIEQLYQKKLQDASNRRNQLLEDFTSKITHGKITPRLFAIGISTAAPAIAKLLRAISLQPQNAVFLPSVDLSMPQSEWDKLLPEQEDSEGPLHLHEVHPQFHLKLLLDRMGFQRSEVTLIGKNPKKSHSCISDIFCIPERTAEWMGLPNQQKKMPNLRLMVADDSAEEAVAVAILAREALEIPGKRIAIVTPDRELALRISSQLQRWGIEANDSAGIAILKTANGTLLKALFLAIAQDFSPNRLLAILQHPLIYAGDDRAEWLSKVRLLDLALRGPILGYGLDAISQSIQDKIADARNKAVDKYTELQAWWDDVCLSLNKLERLANDGLGALLPAVTEFLSAFTQGKIWLGTNGRHLSSLIENIQSIGIAKVANQDRSILPSLLDTLFEGQVVRPNYGGHPRVAIYGLLEARLQQADLILCAGLNEGSWPQLPQPDPWLAPYVRRQLNLAGLERNIGLSAHDLASFMGAEEVVLCRAKRDRSGPTVASRFILRLQAYLGKSLKQEVASLELAREIDRGFEANLAERPSPNPSVEQRNISLSITDFDKLKSDPYAIYARKILSLEPLDVIDAEPSAAWRGSVIHDLLEQWAKLDNWDPAKLIPRAEKYLDNPAFRPTISTLWRPRILAALEWVATETARMIAENGRIPVLAEAKGNMKLAGVDVSGRVDRVDKLGANSFAIIDYKSGKPPSPKQLDNGFALQLGLLGLLLRDGKLPEFSGETKDFEYWSMQKVSGTTRFGSIKKATLDSPKEGKILTSAFVDFARDHAIAAIERWIIGDEEFTAKLHPEYPTYQDFDHLMRLQEWDGRQPIESDDAA
jgi:ATP-dependent helicase/nuclease subunit B